MLPLADEVIVLDSFSTDKTKEICEQLGVTFIQKEWMGYGPTKNYGHSICKHDYILSIDADEEISKELQKSILQEQQMGLTGAYEFNRLNNYAGKWIKYAGWYPDKKIRLFLKTQVSWNEREVHETPVLSKNTKVKWLSGNLLHYSFNTYADHQKKIGKYAQLASQNLASQPKILLLFKMLFNPIIRFFKMYFIKLGFLSGIQGLILCYYTSKEVFLKYFFALQKTTSRKP